jgi:PKHD-type hydroxylase
MPDMDFPYIEGNTPQAIAAIPMDTITKWKPYVVVKKMATTREIKELLKLNIAPPDTYISATQYESMIVDLADTFSQINDEYYHFALTGIYQMPQILTYTPTKMPEGPQQWHSDYSPLDRSKLSMSLCLTAAEQGGLLEMAQYGVAEMRPGDAVFFPSFMYHRVTKVRKGTRTTLVSWAGGPAYV